MGFVGNITPDRWNPSGMEMTYIGHGVYYYLDGALKQTVDERLVLQSAVIEPVKATVADLMLFRAGMNQEEHTTLSDDAQIIHASMELYCPLNEGDATNRAQSLNTVTFQSDVTTFIENIRNDKNKDGYYDLLGRRVDVPMENNIVITTENKKIIHL